MTNAANSLTQWLPVVGTLLGAGIGFAASFFTTKFSKDKEERLLRENRDRERIERIYRLLVDINTEKTTELGGALNSIHYAKPIKQKDLQSFPPLLELEMLINLYFPELEQIRSKLMKEIQAFGEKYIEFGFKDYRQESLKNKQSDSGILVNLQFQVDAKIKEMQKALVSHAKA